MIVHPLDLKWYVLPTVMSEKLQPWTDAVGIALESMDEYRPPEIVLWITPGYANPMQIAERICDLHNEQLEADWNDEAYFHALEKDD